MSNCLVACFVLFVCLFVRSSVCLRSYIYIYIVIQCSVMYLHMWTVEACLCGRSG